jgi:REP element-mobilizing transposase RayT
MRKPRFIIPAGGIYHVTTHAINTGTPYPFGDLEKERQARLMRSISAFSGVNVLTYAFMGNHFHLLLEVPKAPPHIPEGEIITRLNHLPKAPSARRRPGDQIAHEIYVLRKQGGSENVIADKLNRIRDRMYNLSRFMQEFLSRYTQDYNRRHERKGTLWQERFYSTIVEPSQKTLSIVAAYIDLNPVRAGMVSDPKSYRFSGYAASLGGEPAAKQGLKRLAELTRVPPKHMQETYRNLLCSQFKPPKSVAQIDRELTKYELHKLRYRYLTYGTVIGSRLFVQNLEGRWKRNAKLKRSPCTQQLPDHQSLCYLHALKEPL